MSMLPKRAYDAALFTKPTTKEHILEHQNTRLTFNLSATHVPTFVTKNLQVTLI